MFLTRGVERALREAQRVVLRTARHPMAQFLTSEGIAFETLDALYDKYEDFDEFNTAAAKTLLDMCRTQPVCYAVSDASFDTTVAAIQQKRGDAKVRILPGVMGNALSGTHESFEDGLLEHPHYTRPQVFEGREIPPVLTSGNHAEIDKWRREQALKLTGERRPDLLRSQSKD